MTNTTRLQLTASFLAFAAWPATALASSGVETEWGNTSATALLGVAAALAWRQVARRTNVVRRWQQMRLGDRLPVLRLGERLHALHLGEAVSAALRLRHEARRGTFAAAQRRVLIVDDDEDVRSTLREALMVQGFAVSEAVDGYEGLRRAREERPDVVLLDLLMPNMNGFEFRAAQREDARIATIPVVVISATEAPQAQGLGAAAYLHKPFDLSALVAAVDRYALAAA